MVAERFRAGIKFKSKSTVTAGIAIQSALARALDQGHFAMVADIDLSCAFDLVNVNLLIKRMKLIGLPEDIVDLVELWLRDRRS